MFVPPNPITALSQLVTQVSGVRPQEKLFELAIKALNHLLDLEPSLQARLDTHTGRTVSLTWPAKSLAFLELPAGTVYFQITDQLRFQLLDLPTTPASALADLTADVSVTIQTGLIAAPTAERLRYVRIEGDALLAQDLGFLAQHLRWDAEQDLSRIIGGPAATTIVRKAKIYAAAFNDAAKDLQTRTQQAAQGLAGHAPHWLVSPIEMAQHTAELEALSNRVAHLSLPAAIKN